jgi:hypothetical protein
VIETIGFVADGGKRTECELSVVALDQPVLWDNSFFESACIACRLASPGFSPYLPDGARLTCLRLNSTPASPCFCIFVMRRNSRKLNELRIQTSQSGGIPRVSLSEALNKLKKTRGMFWSGRRDLNSGPPAPKPGVLSLGSPSFSIFSFENKRVRKIFGSVTMYGNVVPQAWSPPNFPHSETTAKLLRSVPAYQGDINA